MENVKRIYDSEARSLRELSCDFFNLQRRLEGTVTALQGRKVFGYGQRNEKPLKPEELNKIQELSSGMKALTDPLQALTRELNDRPCYEKPTSKQEMK